MERKISKIQFFQMFMLLLVTGAVCVLVYKAQIRENLHRPLEYTMMTEHKDRGESCFRECRKFRRYLPAKLRN